MQLADQKNQPTASRRQEGLANPTRAAARALKGCFRIWKGVWEGRGGSSSQWLAVHQGGWGVRVLLCCAVRDVLQVAATGVVNAHWLRTGGGSNFNPHAVS